MRRLSKNLALTRSGLAAATASNGEFNCVGHDALARTWATTVRVSMPPTWPSMSESLLPRLASTYPAHLSTLASHFHAPNQRLSICTLAWPVQRTMLTCLACPLYAVDILAEGDGQRAPERLSALRLCACGVNSVSAAHALALAPLKPCCAAPF